MGEDVLAIRNALTMALAEFIPQPEGTAPSLRSGAAVIDQALAALARLAAVETERDARDETFAKLVLLAHKRGDEFWQHELQVHADMTLNEARTFAELRAERDEARQALLEIADHRERARIIGESCDENCVIEICDLARAALPVPARPETDAR